jgi:hypothetical protein
MQNKTIITPMPTLPTVPPPTGTPIRTLPMDEVKR